MTSKNKHQKAGASRRTGRLNISLPTGIISTPTRDQFRAYEAAFDHFNEKLFEGKLSPVMLNFSRKAKSRGFYCPAAWQRDEDDPVAEVSLNPDELDRPARDSLSTLVHEMVHHWQHDFGTPSRPGYHNREWASKMVEVGLYPSHTGKQGGNVVGQNMTHYIVEDGPFDAAFKVMPEDILLPWSSARSLEEATKKRVAKRKTAYSCGGCGARVWGKAGLHILCGECEEPFDQEGGEDGSDGDD